MQGDLANAKMFLRLRCKIVPNDSPHIDPAQYVLGLTMYLIPPSAPAAAVQVFKTEEMHS